METVDILKDVIAYVEVRSSCDNRSAAVCRELELLGAKVATSFTDDVTHVVFKEGLKRTYLKAQKKGIPLVSVSWLESCKRNQTKVPEAEFTALVEKEPDNPLIKMKQNRRWKKMKSMQPCDFDEEVARSAERSTKRRRRIELANRFKFSEDTTPPGGSPAPILALDTQARSPFLSNSSRFSSPNLPIVPDTPTTPTMKERIEKMRREQRNLIGAEVESPRSTGLGTNVLQKRLFEKMAQDLFSTEDSDDEDDNGETTARVVAKLIEGFDTKSTPTSPKKKTLPVIENSERVEEGFGLQECNVGETEVERIFHDESPKNHGSSQRCSLGDEDGGQSSKTAEFFIPERSTPCSKRKSLGSCKENQKRTNGGSKRENRLSTGSSSEDSSVLSPVSANKDPSTEVNPIAAKPVTNGLEEGTSIDGDKSCPEVGTPKSSKAVSKVQSLPNQTKIIKKKKLFSDPVFSMAELPLQETGTSKSELETLTSKEKLQTTKTKKRRRNTEAAEVSFLFKGVEDKVEEKVTTPRRRSKRLSLSAQSGMICTKTSVDNDKSSVNNRSLLNATSTSNASNVSGIANDTSSLKSRKTRNSLGTSMSILFGADSTMLNSSLKCPSRRSIDEFSLKSVNIKAKKGSGKKRVFESFDENPVREKKSLKQIRETNDAPQPNRRNTRGSPEEQKESGCAHNKDSGSDTTEEKLSSPCKLRHANSLVVESMTCNNGGKGCLSLVTTSLHREEQDVVHSIIKKLGVFQIMDNVETSTTHVVCGEPRRTLNLLRAIAGGCWILKKEWVLESLEAGSWLMEENYEMEDDFPAAKESCLKRQTMGKMYKADLFSHIGHICVSKDCIPSRQDLVQLITLCSGKVTSSKLRASVFLGMKYIPDANIVRPTWVLDSIMKMSTQAIESYVIPPPSHREESPEF